MRSMAMMVRLNTAALLLLTSNVAAQATKAQAAVAGGKSPVADITLMKDGHFKGVAEPPG